MPEFATLAPPYSMPAASHGDVDLSDSSSNARCGALSQFLAGVEVRAFKIAQAALRHEDDALDAVQDAMLQLARAYSDRPAEEWKPALLPDPGEPHPGHAAPAHGAQPRHVLAALPRRSPRRMSTDPIAEAASDEPLPMRRLEIDEAMAALEKAPRGAAPAAAAGVSAAYPGRARRGADGQGHGLLGGQRQDTLFSRAADIARAARGAVAHEP